MGQSMQRQHRRRAAEVVEVHRQPCAPPTGLPEHIQPAVRDQKRRQGQRHDGHPDPEHADVAAGGEEKQRRRHPTGQRKQRRQPGEHQAVLEQRPAHRRNNSLSRAVPDSSSASSRGQSGSSVRMPVLWGEETSNAPAVTRVSPTTGR